MRWAYTLLALGSILMSAAYVFSRTPDHDQVTNERGKAEVSIVLTEQSFVPNKVQIDAGTKVTFTTTRPNDFWPASNAHPSHAIYPEFDPKQPVGASSSWSFIPKKGVWGYHDHIRSYFTGTLYVE